MHTYKKRKIRNSKCYNKDINKLSFIKLYEKYGQLDKNSPDFIALTKLINKHDCTHQNF